MASDRALRMTPRILFGLFLMSVGVIFGLDTLGVIEAGEFIRFWPLLLIVGGLVKLVSPGCSAGGIFWVAAGSALLLHTLDIVRIWRLWPFGLVLLGAYIAYRALSQEGKTRDRGAGAKGPRDPAVVFEAWRASGHEQEGSARAPGTAPDDGSVTLNIVAVMGGVERRVRTKDFRGGSLVAFMGGCEIDLRDSSMESGEVVLDTTAIWGGIELKVPGDWRVESRGLALLGGFADKTHGPADSTKLLVVTGLAVMGGVEIRN